MTLYKVLGPNAESIHCGKATWHKPSGKRPGVWMPAVADVQCCKRGYHLVELYALPEWLRANCTIWEAEGKGPSHTDGSGKTAYTQARLLRRLYLSERDMRLFAADCAEHVLHIFERKWPNDDRPRKAIEAARAYARGEIDATQLAAATHAADAAYAAARAAADAAYAAAQDGAAADAAATHAADAAYAAARAAADAAYAAARAAAHAAHAADAAWAAERQWQGELLATYLREGPDA